MQSNFHNSLIEVLKSEGGNDDDPSDHGGRTSRGITQGEYTAWLKESKRPFIDVWKAPQSDIEAIYLNEYWNPWCDLLPIGVDYLFFDMSVNSGPHEAIVLGQRALGVTADGRIGPITREAIRAATSIDLINKYTAQKEIFYRALHQPRFLKGWLNRNKDAHNIAIKMI